MRYQRSKQTASRGGETPSLRRQFSVLVNGKTFAHFAVKNRPLEPICLPEHSPLIPLLRTQFGIERLYFRCTSSAPAFFSLPGSGCCSMPRLAVLVLVTSFKRSCLAFLHLFSVLPIRSAGVPHSPAAARHSDECDSHPQLFQLRQTLFSPRCCRRSPDIGLFAFLFWFLPLRLNYLAEEKENRKREIGIC